MTGVQTCALPICNKVPTYRKKQAEDSLRKTLQVWISGVELALAEFTKLERLPHKLLLCGGGSSLEMLVDELSNSNWYRELPFTRKPEVQHIEPEATVGIIDKTGAANDHTYITAMGLLRVGLDTINQQTGNTLGGSIKERINRLLSV